MAACVVGSLALYHVTSYTRYKQAHAARFVHLIRHGLMGFWRVYRSACPHRSLDTVWASTGRPANPQLSPIIPLLFCFKVILHRKWPNDLFISNDRGLWLIEKMLLGDCIGLAAAAAGDSALCPLCPATLLCHFLCAIYASLPYWFFISGVAMMYLNII